MTALIVFPIFNKSPPTCYSFIFRCVTIITFDLFQRFGYIRKLIEQLNRFGIFQHENPSIVCLDTRMLLHLSTAYHWLSFDRTNPRSREVECFCPDTSHHKIFGISWQPATVQKSNTENHVRSTDQELINWSKQIETCSNACSFQKMLVVMLIWRKSFPMNCHQFYSL